MLFKYALLFIYSSMDKILGTFSLNFFERYFIRFLGGKKNECRFEE